MSAGIRMQHGSFVASKKLVKELAKTQPEKLVVESYSLFGTEYFDGDNLPIGRVFTFAGPDPFHKRNWYGTIVRTKAGIQVK